MNHRATFVLSLAAGRVLDVLHSVLDVGELGIISHAEIARLGGISEGTVSKAMYVLTEHGFLTRAWDDDLNGGRGGYTITLLPLPEETPTHPSVIGSIADPIADDTQGAALMQQTLPTVGTADWDHSVIGAAPNMEDHDLDQQQQSCARDQNLPDTPLVRVLRKNHAASPVIRQILQTRPDRTLEEWERQLCLARLRPGVRSPRALVFGLWMRGEDVQEQDPHDNSTADRRRPIQSEHAPHQAQRSAAERSGYGQTSHFPAGWGVPAWLGDD